MGKIHHKEIHKRLSVIVMKIFDYMHFYYVNEEEFKNTFFENLSEILKIAFDLNLDIKKLEAFTKKFENKATVIEGAIFLVDVLKHENTYVLLNYYYYRFIQSCLVVTREEHIGGVENLIEQAEITEFDINKLKLDYYNLVTTFQRSLKSC